MKGAYNNLALEMAVDFVIMYLVMYTMIASLDHFRLNLNNAYMTLMMVTPMTIVVLVSMRSMYPSPRRRWRPFFDACGNALPYRCPASTGISTILMALSIV